MPEILKDTIGPQKQFHQHLDEGKFKLKIHKQLQFSSNESIENITLVLNKILEKMIIKNPTQWIWTHNRWK